MPTANFPRVLQNRQRFAELSPHQSAFFSRILNEIQHYKCRGRQKRLVAAAFWSTGFAREHAKITTEPSVLLKARYKFGIVRAPPEARGADVREGGARAFMIAIMPNTISRKILSANRTTARVGNRAKNNNEMSAERTREERTGGRTVERKERDGKLKEGE